VEHNVGVTSKDDGVSDYSDASLNGRKDSLQDGEGNDGDHHHDDDYDEDADEDEDDDEQPVKLFIGQVPKQMEEPDLFAIFEKYGPMEDVAIIRDKHTGQHRGCAFVTFLQKESAELCEKELHGTFVFGGRQEAGSS
jgi:RNA-binding proteins (RRM domain)